MPSPQDTNSMVKAGLKYYIGKILCTADPNDPGKFIHHKFNRIFLVFGFSAGGKDSVINAFLKQNKTYNFSKFIRTLSRHKRSAELDMYDGFFVDPELFDYLKNHQRFFYSYKRYNGQEFGYDTMHLLFELSRSNIFMVGGSEQNYEGLTEGIKSIFDEIPITTIFINRPLEDIKTDLQKRKADPEEIRARMEALDKDWYEKPKKPIDYTIWNDKIDVSVVKMQSIVKEVLGPKSI